MKFKLCTGDKMFEVSFIVTEKNNKWSLVDWEEKRQRFGMCVVRRRFNCQILLENETINQVQEKEWSELPSVRKGRQTDVYELQMEHIKGKCAQDKSDPLIQKKKLRIQIESKTLHLLLE